ncbi:MAG: plasmid pRiA4b ORF-3 family protein [Chloroflexota bacterium]|nr:plasmid pRiA4b ORF-3 family protein [Chloroflexota bacterium]
MPATEQGKELVYQVKVTLKGVRPPVWRRFLVRDVTLHELHLVLQAAMGWENSHLYQFTIGGDEYSDPLPDLDMKDSTRIRLGQVFRSAGTRFTYVYDFGDSWEHEVRIEKSLAAEAGKRYPVCLAGRRACPPEDCGGVWGYEELLEAIRDPEHEQHQELLEWLGGPFDPEAFSVALVNKVLAGSPYPGDDESSPRP